MSIRDIARDSYHLATSLVECPFSSFWVVLLGDGTEVYQSEDDASLKEPSPWMRLKLLCKEHNIKIHHMAYAFREGCGTQINCVPDADGYFFSKRIRKLMASHPDISGFSDDAIGVGWLRNGMLEIRWRRNDGVVEEELRDTSKQTSFSLICN